MKGKSVNQEEYSAATQAVRQADMVAICAVIATTVIGIAWLIRLLAN